MMLKKILLGAVAITVLAACQPDVASNVVTGSVISTDKSPALDIQFDIPYKEFTLDNGLRVVVHEDRKAPIVSVGVWYHVGSKDEPEGKTGFAHLFEHLMFNGSENYDDEWFKPMENIGATALNGTTWFDRTNYFENVPTPALDLTLWMESDRMGHLLGAVTQAKLDEQIGVVQNEKRQGDNQPYGQFQYQQLEGLFPVGHPYRHSTIGSLADLQAASLDDVKDWFKQYYGAANTVIVLSGDIDVETAKPLMEKYFGPIGAGPALKRHTAWIPTRANNTVEDMVDPTAPQVRISRSWAVATRNDVDASYLNLVASLLGGGKNSRLYQALVYKSQLATAVTVNMQPFELASTFTIHVTLKDGADEVEAERLMNAEINKLLAEGPEAGELKRAKTRLLAGRIRGLEAIGGFNGKGTALARSALYAGDAGFYAKTIDWMNRASAANITAAANRWIGTGYYQITMRPEPKYTTVADAVDRSTGLPEVGDLPQLAFPDIQEATLSNGMKLVLATRSTIPVVNMAIQFDAGYAADQGIGAGTASFTLAMLDEGTTTRSALDISAEREGLGATIGTGSDLDTSRVAMSALKSNLGASLDLLADVVKNPAFDQEEFDRQKQQWLARIQQEKAQPVGIALRALPPLLYGPDHAYGNPFTGSGTTAAIEALTRDDLVAFHKNWLRPDNATIFMVGDITMEEAVPAVEKALGTWKAPTTAIPTKNIAPVAIPDGATVIIVDKPNSPQSFILAGHLMPSTGDAGNLALTTANGILGGSFTARVNMNLREDKHWSYGAQTIKLDARGQAMWIVFAPVQTDKTMESIAELQKEFSGFLGSVPPTEDELMKVKRANTNSLPGNFETGNAVLNSLLSNKRFGRSNDYVTTLTAQYGNLDLDSVKAAAASHIKPGSLTWLIVGDRAVIEEGIRSLNLGTVEIHDADGNKVE